MMPKDAPKQAAAAAPSVQDWIEKFNTAKGWKPLGPAASKEVLMVTPHNRFEEALARSTSDAMEANNALRQAQRRADAIRNSLEDMPEGAQKERAEQALEQAEEAHAQALVAYQKARELEVKQGTRLRQITEVEEDLDQDLGQAVQRVSDLQDALATQTVDPYAAIEAGEKEKEFLILQQMRDDVAKDIEKARSEVFTMIKVEGSTRTERKYATICPEEYKILHAMLDEAMLIYLTGDPQAAMKAIVATREQMFLYRSARTGAIIIEQQEAAFDPRLSGPLGAIDGQISWLRFVGLTAAADELEAESIRLRRSILETQNNAPETVYASHWGEVKAHQDVVEDKVEDAKTCVHLTEDIYRCGKTLRAMEAPAKADALEVDLRGLDNDPYLGVRRQILQGILRQAETEIRLLRRAQAAAENVDISALTGQLQTLQASYDAAVKKKNKSIPEEALEEIEMKLSAAQQLIESESVDALRLAKEYLDEVGAYESSVTQNAKVFDDIIRKLKLVNKELARLQSKYGAYEATRTVSLKSRVEKFEGSYKSQDPVESARALFAMSTEAGVLKADVRRCKAAYDACAKVAKAVQGKIDALSKLMSKNPIHGVEISGYFGAFVNDLAEARRIADERDEVSLERAGEMLVQLQIDLDEAVGLAAKFNKSKSSNAMSGSEKGAWIKLREDTVRGQQKEEAREAQQKLFETEYTAVKAMFTKLVQAFTALNMDASDLEIALHEIAGLKAQAKASGDYEEPLKRLAELKQEARRHTATAGDMASFKKLDVEKAAADCASKLRAFTRAVVGLEGEIAKVGDVADLLSSDGNTRISSAEVKSYLQTVAGFVRDTDLAALETNGKLMQQALDAGDNPRPPREAALSALRSLTGALQGNAPLAHYRKQPFTGVNPELEAAMAALPRLEIKLLTAVPK
jgi:hypothetical protein